jgi:hypothetical protein
MTPGCTTPACFELVDVAELGLARPHTVKSPRGQCGVEMIEELVVSERIHRGRVTRQGLDGLEAEIDAGRAELLAGIEPPDGAAEVTNQRFEDGTALGDSFLERPALSCGQQSTIPHLSERGEGRQATDLGAELQAHPVPIIVRCLLSWKRRRSRAPPVHPIPAAFTDRHGLRGCGIAQRSAVDL